MSLSGKAILAGVIGWPVAHSKSPRLHGYWLDHYGIDGAYLPLPVRPENLDYVLRALPRMGFQGVNLTLPHKEMALSQVDRLDPLAARIGAVNTIVVSENGMLEGYNTDAFGFLENLRQCCPDFDPTAETAVVLGAGGAARAVVAALIDAGCREIRLANRSPARAWALAEALALPGESEILSVAWEDRADALDGAGLLVNTTRLGMVGEPALEIDLTALSGRAAVCDIVYTPLTTDLLHRAALRGNRTVDGLGMLLHQARPGFSKWFGIMPDVTADLRALMETS